MDRAARADARPGQGHRRSALRDRRGSSERRGACDAKDLSQTDDDAAPVTERLSRRGTDATVVQLQDITLACWLVMMRPSGAPEAQTDAHTLRGTAAGCPRLPLSVCQSFGSMYDICHSGFSHPLERSGATAPPKRARRTRRVLRHRKKGASHRPGGTSVAPTTDEITPLIRPGASHSRHLFAEILLHESCSGEHCCCNPPGDRQCAMEGAEREPTSMERMTETPQHRGHVASLAPPHVATCVSAAL